MERCSKVNEFEAKISGLSLESIYTTTDGHKDILKCSFICSYLSSLFFNQSSSFLKQEIDLLQQHMAI